MEEEGVEDCQAWRCVARIGGTRRAAARAEELESFEHVRCQHSRRAMEEDGVTNAIATNLAADEQPFEREKSLSHTILWHRLCALCVVLCV